MYTLFAHCRYLSGKDSVTQNFDLQICTSWQVKRLYLLQIYCVYTRCFITFLKFLYKVFVQFAEVVEVNTIVYHAREHNPKHNQHILQLQFKLVTSDTKCRPTASLVFRKDNLSGFIDKNDFCLFYIRLLSRIHLTIVWCSLTSYGNCL